MKQEKALPFPAFFLALSGWESWRKSGKISKKTAQISIFTAVKMGKIKKFSPDGKKTASPTEAQMSLCGNLPAQIWAIMGSMAAKPAFLLEKFRFLTKTPEIYLYLLPKVLSLDILSVDFAACF